LCVPGRKKRYCPDVVVAMTRPTLSFALFLFLAELFAFAGRFNAHAPCTAVPDAFFVRMSASGIPYANVRDVYAVANAGTGEQVQGWEDELPKGLLWDCLVVAGQDGVEVVGRGMRG
jgi:hypothetical protein